MSVDYDSNVAIQKKSFEAFLFNGDLICIVNLLDRLNSLAWHLIKHSPIEWENEKEEIGETVAMIQTIAETALGAGERIKQFIDYEGWVEENE